ncbi:carbohydrate kinase family protein [Haloferax gibbonsii]|nr:carbohydrate kinase [Haloferax gibbonsii]
MTDVLVAGETIIDFLPTETGELAHVEEFTRCAGGAPANVAVALSHLEETPLFWTRLGSGPFGDFLAETLESVGLPMDFVERDENAKTGLAFVNLGEDAEREFTFYHSNSAETRFQPGTVEDETLDSISWVHFDGLSLDAEPSRDAIFDLARRASESGSTVSFDPNARPERWTEFDYADSMYQAFEYADVVKATPEDMAEMDVDGDADELAEHILEHGPHTALITLGSEGSFASTTDLARWTDSGTSVSHGGFEVDQVDTTGAGDAFTAGCIAALVEGQGLEEALSFANAVAARATTAHGAMEALPDRDAVAALQRDR